MSKRINPSQDPFRARGDIGGPRCLSKAFQHMNLGELPRDSNGLLKYQPRSRYSRRRANQERRDADAAAFLDKQCPTR